MTYGVGRADQRVFGDKSHCYRWLLTQPTQTIVALFWKAQRDMEKAFLLVKNLAVKKRPKKAVAD